MSKANWLDDLLGHRLLINMGKGGVGRSTFTAALARLAANAGKKVLVCEVNTKERMPSLLGASPPETLDTLDRIWQADERIWTVNIEPWTGMKEYVVQVLRLRLVYNLVFQNRVMKYFLQAVPGLQELVYIGKTWYHVSEDKRGDEPRFDLVLVDAPATGHGLAMLRITSVILQISPPGPMRKATERIQDMLADGDICRINFVTLPEEMPVNETIELYEKIETQLELPLGVVCVNQWPAAPCDEELRGLFHQTLEAGLRDPEGWPLWAAGQQAEIREQRALRHLKNLRQHIPLPVVKMPRLHHPEHDESHMVHQLATALQPRR